MKIIAEILAFILEKINFFFNFSQFLKDILLQM